MEKIIVYEKKSFVNSRGFEIVQLVPTDGSSSIFHGIAIAGMQTDKPGEVIPKRFQFEFPEEITTIDTAFENFEKYLKNEVELYIAEEQRQIELAEKEANNSGPIIVPNGPMPFNPNFLKK